MIGLFLILMIRLSFADPSFKNRLEVSADVIHLVRESDVAIFSREMTPRMSLIFCVALAGGFNGWGGSDQVHLVRFSGANSLERVLSDQKVKIADLKVKKIIQSFKSETLEADGAGIVLQNNDLIVVGYLTEERLSLILREWALSASAGENKSLSEIPFFRVEGIHMGMSEGQFTEMHAEASKQVGVGKNTYVIKKTAMIWYSFVFDDGKLRIVRVFGPTKVSPASVPPELSHTEQMKITEEWINGLKAASDGASEEVRLGRMKDGHPLSTKGISYPLSEFGAHTKAVLESSSIQLIVTFFDSKIISDDMAYMTFERVQSIAPKKNEIPDYEATDYLIGVEKPGDSLRQNAPVTPKEEEGEGEGEE